MGKIDYNKSLVGEIFPLTDNANEIGHLGHLHNLPLNDYQTKKVFYYVGTTDKNKVLKFRWKFTPINNNEVLISCSHPKKAFNGILTFTLVNKMMLLVVEERALPVNEEEVPAIARFKIKHIEGSPLFFEITGHDNGYCIADRFNAPFKLDGVAFNLVHYGEFYQQYKKELNEPDYRYAWFIAIDEEATSSEIVKTLSAVPPLRAISEKLRINIDESYLKQLRH